MKRTIAFLSLMLVFTVVGFGQAATLKAACSGSCCPDGCAKCCTDGSCSHCCQGK